MIGPSADDVFYDGVAFFGATFTSSAVNAVIVILRESGGQCDQIWRNFAT